MNYRIIFLLVLLSAMFIGGCKHQPATPVTMQHFDQDLDRLVSDVADSIRNRPEDIAPFSIVSKNALDGKPYTRLDEMVCSRLAKHFSESKERIALSRENWFELNAGRKISVKGHPASRHRFIDSMVLYMVDIETEPVFNRVNIIVTAKDRHLNTLPGIKGKIRLNVEKQGPAFVLTSQNAQSNPYPVGLEGNPFHSVEAMAFSLASELSFAAQRGLKTQRFHAKDDEIQVVLCTPKTLNAQNDFSRTVVQELQQALVTIDGITCAVSQMDFAPIRAQMDFYQNNPAVFEKEFEKFKPGSVILMAETRQNHHLHQVALRAVWRVSPLKDTKGLFIPENSTGTYLSGFTSRAWFKGRIPVTGQHHVDPQPAKKYTRAPAMGFD